MKKSEIDDIVLIGGASRMPMVVKLLTHFFGKKPIMTISPDEAIVYGASI